MITGFGSGMKSYGYSGVPKNTINSMVERRTYGANLRRFLKKARDWRSGKPFAQAPTIAMLGDSITSGIWTTDFRTWLCDAYTIPEENFKIYAYGGYSVMDMLPSVEEMLIFPNPDLIIFGEYEGMNDGMAGDIENIISLCRNRTTADICLSTWSMKDTVATAYLADRSTLIDDAEYQNFNWYRDIAGMYNCELIDLNEALKNALDKGGQIAQIWSDGPHLTDFGYQTVLLPEIQKHFGESDWQLALNIPYPLKGKEEMLYLANSKRMDLFSDSGVVTTTGTWTTDNVDLKSSSAGATVEIEMKDIVGFEILHGINAGATLQLKESGGSYAAPSTFQFNGRPLQHTTEIEFVGDDSWRDKRPFKKGVVVTNELTDGVLRSGRYTIVVQSIVVTTVNCEMFDPDSVSLGTFQVGQAATFVAGNLSFTQKYNGENNYKYDTPFTVGDTYAFYVLNNWCDSLKSAYGPEIMHTEPILNEQPGNVVTADPLTRIFRYQYTVAPNSSMQWTGLTPGHTYRIVYEELTRTGTGKVAVVSDGVNVELSEAYSVYDFTLTSGYFYFNRSSGDEFEDVTFRSSVRDITANQEYKDTKKVYGLPRGDYTLKATVGTATDLYAIRMLH